MPISAAIEAEISSLPESERPESLESVGLSDTGLRRVIQAGYALLDLLTFLTANANEARASTVRTGATAPQAAGELHTDFERGFIRAEVIRFEDLRELGSESAVKQAGRMRVEGKEYVVQDGDVMFFRFAL